MTVALRFALREPDASAGAAATVLVALVVALVAATADAGVHGMDIDRLWPFALAGLLAPGGSQILFTLGIC